MRIALAQINTTIADIDGNVARMLDAAAQAHGAGADIVAFPELAVTSYPPRDLLLRQNFVEAQRRALDEMAARLPKIAAIVGFVGTNDSGRGKPLRNSLAVLQSGRVTDVRHKMLLPTYDVFDERRYFEPAAETSPVEINGALLGLTICEDAWACYEGPGTPAYGKDPFRLLTEQGARVHVNISASPFVAGKPATRTRLLSDHAKRNAVPVLYVNQVGGNDELIFDGDSQVLAADGSLRMAGKPFEEDLLIADLDALPAPIQRDVLTDTAAIHKALVLGTRDFVRKCGFSGVVLGLSGGIDSTVVAAIAAEALGPENVTGISMPSVYSSSHSLEDAAALARNLGIHYEVLPISPAFDALQSMLGDHLADEEAADIAVQNLQARLRGTLVMAMANRHGWLGMATGNKSELSTGYCTLYGDMCGALAPLGDVLKTQVYAVARHINAEREVIPERVITKAPSAELRPNQTDQDSLPPYDALDGILEAYVGDERGEEEIVALGYDPAVVADVLRRISTSEHKRRQAAPCLKVTSRAFGHGRRLPIARKTL